MMTILEVNEKLKQRPPFQMIDRVYELVPGEYARGRKCVSVNEPYFVGHFPGAPIMPGVMVMESCAQMCSLCIELPVPNEEVDVLLKVNNFTFLKAIIPGDVMEITVKKTRGGGILTVFDVEVAVDGEVYAKGSMTFATAPIEQVYTRKE